MPRRHEERGHNATHPFVSCPLALGPGRVTPGRIIVGTPPPTRNRSRDFFTTFFSDSFLHPPCVGLFPELLAKWLHLGAILEQFWSHFATFFEVGGKHENCNPSQAKTMFLRSGEGPFSHFFDTLSRSAFQTLFREHFFMFFIVFVPKWCPKGDPGGGPRTVFRHFLHLGTQMSPRWLPDGPQMAPGGPKATIFDDLRPFFHVLRLVNSYAKQGMYQTRFKQFLIDGVQPSPYTQPEYRMPHLLIFNNKK